MRTLYPNTLKVGDTYYIVKIIRPHLLQPEENFELREFIVTFVADRIVYGEKKGSGINRIHSVEDIFKDKGTALKELRKLYIKKYNLIKAEADSVLARIDVIEEEIPDVQNFSGVDCSRPYCSCGR